MEFRQEYNQILSNLTCQTTFDNFDRCDFIIETGYEDLRLKQKNLHQLEQYISPHCIIALNTYVLPIHQIAENSSRPDKVKSNRINKQEYI